MAHWLSRTHHALKHVEAEIEHDASEAVFGSFDGLVSTIGVVVGLLGKPSHTILVATAGLAAANLVGMGAGQFLGDPKRRLGKAAVMGLAALLGVLLPAAPFALLPGGVALPTGIAVALALTLGIALQRSRSAPWQRAFLETYGVVAAAAALTVIVTLLTGATG